MSQIHTREIAFGGKGGSIVLQSAIGPQKQISELTEQIIGNGMSPTGIFCFGISHDGTNAHLVYIDPDISVGGFTASDIAAVSGTFSKEDAISTLLPGFNYSSFVSRMDTGVFISAWDNGIKTDRLTNKAYSNFCRAIFNTDGKIKNTESNTILLLSRQGERILCASRDKETDPLTKVMTPINTGIPTFGVACGNIVLTAQMDGQQVFAIRVESIAQIFETGERPKWISKGLPVDKIDDLSLPVDEKGSTIILTAIKNGKRYLIPTVIAEDTKGIQITLCIGESAIEIRKSDPAPQRIDATTTFVVARQNNGGPDRLQVTTIKEFAGGNTAFVDMIEKATSGGFLRATA